MSFKNTMIYGLPIVTILAIFGSHLVIVPTDSMYPTINEGDIVFIQKIDVLGVYGEFDPEDVKMGDIIVFEKKIPKKSVTVGAKSVESNPKSGLATSTSKKNNSEKNGKSESEIKETIIHRVVAVHKSNGKKYFIVKGDHNTVSDYEKVSFKQVTGRAVILNGGTLRISDGWELDFCCEKYVEICWVVARW